MNSNESPFGRTVLFPFLLSRFIVFSIFLIAPLTFLPTHLAQSRSIAFSRETNVRAAVSEALLAGDAIHYMDIAQHGYAAPVSRAWFPLFPILWRAAASVTGEYPITGCLLANGFFLLALFLLHKTVIAFGYSQAVASRSVLYLTIFPMSHLFSVPLTESLFLLLSVGAFYAAKAGRWWLAGAVGALASATRLAGLLLVPALALLFFFQCWSKRSARRQVLWLALIPFGFIAFCSYMHFATGDFLAYRHSPQMSLYTEPGFFLTPLIRYALHPSAFHEWSFLPLQFGMAILGFVCSWKLVTARQWVLASYLVGSLLLPLSAGIIGSMTRFLMVSFPLVIVWAEYGESFQIDHTLRTVSISLLVLLTLACALKFGLGMA